MHVDATIANQGLFWKKTSLMDFTVYFFRRSPLFLGENMSNKPYIFSKLLP